jgi:glycosyltransferase involved in cell wall biosynthesis
MKSILAITHDTSLSGAPKSLVLMLEELNKKGIEITTIAIKGGGPLETQFQKNAKQYFNFEKIDNSKNYSIKNRLKRILLKKAIVSEREKFTNYIHTQKFDFIYTNTISALKMGMRFFYNETIPFVLHVHELKTVIDEFVPNLKEYDPKISHYIVPSELNKNTLIDHFQINETKISIVRETSTLRSVEKRNIETDRLKIIMCGGAYWRKGDDLFVQIAAKVIQQIKNSHFYWIGHITDERLRVNLADAEKLNITDQIHFIQETITPENWMSNANLFMLTSREDPFPLAAIEAGLLGLPIICFQKATGIAEVIQEECTIPYLDVDKMATKIIELLHNKTKREQLGEENKLYFSTLTPKNIAHQVLSILTNLQNKN